MTNGPAAIRLTDLADPVYPDACPADAGGLAAYGAVARTDTRGVAATATERTGLDDWGDPAFRERLDVLCGALRDEAGLSDAGTAVVFEQLVGNLVNRLRLQALVKRASRNRGHRRSSGRSSSAGCRARAPRTCTTCWPPIRRCATCPTGRASSRFPSPGEGRARAGTAVRGGPGDGRTPRMPEFKRMHEMTVDQRMRRSNCWPTTSPACCSKPPTGVPVSRRTTSRTTRRRRTPT